MVSDGSMVCMTFAAEPFKGLFVPLITPFTDEGDLDANGLEALAHRVLQAGATGIVALGTTAEAPTLTATERAQVLDICAGVCRDRAAPLIAGAGTNDTRQSARALAALAAWPMYGPDDGCARACHSPFTKKWSRSLMIGPLTEKPYCST